MLILRPSATATQTTPEPLRIGGAPVVNLVASTSGTDSDWIVKLIDVYPDEVPSQPEMGGYQLAIAMDIFRETWALHQGDAARPSRRRRGELHRAAGGQGARPGYAGQRRPAALIARR